MIHFSIILDDFTAIFVSYSLLCLFHYSGFPVSISHFRQGNSHPPIDAVVFQLSKSPLLAYVSAAEDEYVPGTSSKLARVLLWIHLSLEKAA